MPYEGMDSTRVLRMAEDLADKVWPVVGGWSGFARYTVGRQLVEAADSVGANIAESLGRFHPRDVVNFLYHARGSLFETKYWLRRAEKRLLLSPEEFQRIWQDTDELGRSLNAYLRAKKERVTNGSGVVRERGDAHYSTGLDDASDDLPW